MKNRDEAMPDLNEVMPDLNEVMPDLNEVMPDLNEVLCRRGGLEDQRSATLRDMVRRAGGKVLPIS